ncbi:hypothetical protein BJF89_07605 [Corynebacterium sp. CNJ-954]|uniref:GNAT family N-acetyltransferase n=1 Tax=Corynebacterium sp. CNJ-954 TaxID=1904962 RepID=UPI0009614F50|nr:GNAT family N-acetyltransferase [Corynebacterium sp. CNJ-954]OLT51548.1 hypothetical protein BJF89_07605 [Corynebacterium sp. CNJ-954]
MSFSPEDDTGPARLADASDIPWIQELERRAGEPFRSVGLDAVADDEPPGTAELAAAVADGCVLVIDGAGTPASGHLAAWLWVGTADGDCLIEQVSVDPACRGQRLGTRLISVALEHARRREFPAVCLTTFVDVPWNGPLYRRLGFLPLADDELGPDLSAIREDEQAAGLDVARRRAYRRAVPSRTPTTGNSCSSAHLDQ